MIEGTRTTAHVLIHGRVQGVGFRAWVWRTASELGLTGWVRNRRDGTVEALFEGASADVEDMLARCAEGPSHPAAVARVEMLQDHAAAPSSSFEVYPTV